ncbi:hypothetical protein K1T71_003782 [Dendrolimus kikuchii]|uniref:Uncharacterized protein n=1 Tax=Dendrolimus kikuchii TaxID=765133 RepID=A0ACC1D8Y5_9NEOP|nr:hypothetical protein K1T71_003782 [Dendrolimus kikuchii]
MDVCVYVTAVSEENAHGQESLNNDSVHSDLNTIEKGNEADPSEKHSAVWTNDATSTLLKLYESKLEMLETPKKKTRIWQAISDKLKEHSIEMTPDQVRWKINALTKKYKQCINSGQHEKFKYFKEMDNIYAQYNVDCDSYLTEMQHQRNDFSKPQNIKMNTKQYSESKAMIELRKIRFARRMESDRSQGKIQLERQWLQYLQRQEDLKLWRDDIYEKNLKLKEEELELKKRELELMESLECKKIELLEREHKFILQNDREKCELLKQVLCKKNQEQYLKN